MSRGWSLAHRRLHTLALALLLYLGASGLLLYVPSWHGPLIPWLGRLYWSHVAAGLAFTATLAAGCLPAAPERRLRRVDWGATLALGAGTCATGIALAWLALPATYRGSAFTWHGILAAALLAWALWHGIARWSRSASPLPGAPMSRRGFLAYLARGLAAGVALPLIGAGRSAIGGAMGPPIHADHVLPGFTVYSVTGELPSYDPTVWRLFVGGLTDQVVNLSLEELRAMPAREVEQPFQCVTGWVVPRVRWRGVAIGDLLARVRPRPEVRHISFYAYDGAYSDSLSLEQATAPEVLLAYEVDGEPLPLAHGAPLRLVVPGMYGYKSVKWVSQLLLTAGPHIGYWERLGYPVDAFVRRLGPPL